MKANRARLEAFSDGVIAVIITIMVLELKVPPADGWAGLLGLLPTLAVYLLSFVFTGIYWINHGHLIDRLKHIDAFILWANLGLLFALSLLPFFTTYLIQKHLDAFSTALYAGSMAFSALTFQLLSLAVKRVLDREKEIDAGEVAAHRSERWKGYVSLAIYLVSMGLAPYHPHVALGFVALFTLPWITPNLGTAKTMECASGEAAKPGAQP